MATFDDLWTDRIGPLSSTLPTFGSDGKLMGNITSLQGVKPSANLLNDQTVPNIGGSASLSSIKDAASAAGIVGGGTPPAATTGNIAATTGGTANNWFVRAVVVILGFIFVAVGLSQFNAGQNVVRAAIKRI